MINLKIKGYLYFLLQVMFIVVFLFSDHIFPTTFFYGLFEVSGVILGFWSVWEMKRSLSLLPFIKPNAQLVMTGPYKYIRHPMYSSIILTFIPILIDHFNLVRLLTFLFLILVLNLKLKYEERLLEEKFTGYITYKSRTSRIIPMIY